MTQALRADIDTIDLPRPPASDPARAAPRPVPSKRRTQLLALGAVAAIALGGGGYWRHSLQLEETDDAQVDGSISSVSPRVTGTIKAVYVVENQEVRAGDVLAEIDPADLAVSLWEAKAAVAQAEAQLRAEDPTVSITETTRQTQLASTSSDLAGAQASVSEARKSVDQLEAQLAQAQANDRTVQLDRERAERLAADGAIARAELDQRANAAVASSANLESLRHALEAARDHVAAQQARAATIGSKLSEVRSNGPREVETRAATVEWRRASLELAKARLAQAELNLSYTKIVAPFAGVVGKKAVSVGDRVAPGQQLMALVPLGDLWVTANFRENQLERMRVGQPADVKVDALGATLSGTVVSFGGATGSRFSVLPPDNASGNYVKVVQRIPVRIKLDAAQAGLDRLRPGMSVEPTVRLP
jgi:membrane fusion protein (multidrug efflux system)